MDMVEGLLFKSLREWVECSQCGKTQTDEHIYMNRKTGEKWCGFCLSLEKKKRLDAYIRPEERD